MQKIASNGATVTNEFTEGNASLAIPATVVSADWLNSVQREFVSFISSLGGLTPLTNVAGPTLDTYDQLQSAVKTFFERGGRLAPVATTVANNQASAADVAGFPTFSKTVVRSIKSDYYLRRRTDSENVHAMGTLNILFDVETSSWKVFQNETEPCGVVFSVAVDTSDVSGNTFKVQYTSDSFAGASYASEAKFSNVTKILI